MPSAAFMPTWVISQRARCATQRPLHHRERTSPKSDSWSAWANRGHQSPLAGPDLFRAACRMGLEGLVSKRRDRAYRGGRCLHWIKIKNPNSPAMKRAELVDWSQRRGKDTNTG